MQEKSLQNGREEITFLSYFVLPAVQHCENVFSD
jgi:hypothetical protein